MRCLRLIPLFFIACLVLSFAGVCLQQVYGVENRSGQPLDPPKSFFFKHSSGEKIRGHMTAWDERGFDYLDTESNPQRLRWIDLKIQDQFRGQSRLLDQRSAVDWVRLGARLYVQPKGQAAAEQAFKKALRIDENQEGVINRIRSGEVLLQPESPPTPAAPEESTEQVPTHRAGPHVVGESKAHPWPEQTLEQRDANIQRLKDLGNQVTQQINHDLVLLETKYFLFYTDIHEKEARRWASLMDRMYRQLCQLFDIPDDTNIWNGKCLIFVFQEQRDFIAFEQRVHNANVQWAAGMCTQFGNGDVHVSFFRQPNEQQFARILVHETVHGFLHRYRTSQRIPSWANEGLAEYIAGDLVPQATHFQRRYQRTQKLLQARGHRGFFEAAHISPPQYDLAYIFTTYMIRQNREGYRDFIQGIKEGLTWKESLIEKYGADENRILYALSRKLN